VDRSASRPSLAPSAWWLASLVLVLHVGTAGRYGYFGDELYYLACARRPAWGYPDLGPASIALLRAWTGLVGTSLVAIRIVPAIASAVTVLLTALLARRLGGEARAQTIAALAVAVGAGLPDRRALLLDERVRSGVLVARRAGAHARAR
jgi:4-amino-4-deoxy-L-arabinose transferase-like glycosyltransferase